jgi:hypothetical protein
MEGTAGVGDFEAGSRVIQFAAGEMFKHFEIATYNSEGPFGHRYFFVHIDAASSGVTINGSDVIEVTILEPRNVFGFRKSSKTFIEGAGEILIEVVAEHLPIKPTKLGWEITGSDMGRYLKTNRGEVFFDPNQQSASIFIQTLDDTIFSSNLTFNVVLKTEEPGSVISRSNLTLFRFENDFPNLPGEALDLGPQTVTKTSDGGTILIGGMEQVHGVQVKHAVKLTASGAVNPTFTIPTNWVQIFSVAEVLNSNLLFSVDLKLADGRVTNQLVLCSADGVSRVSQPYKEVRLVQRLFSGPGHSVVAEIAYRPGRIISRLDSKFVKFLANGSKDTNFVLDIWPSSFVNLKWTSSGKFYAHGDFGDFPPRPGGLEPMVTPRILARFLANGMLDETFTVAVGGIVNSISISGDDKILVAGSFRSFNTSSNLLGLVRLFSSGEVDVAFSPKIIPSSRLFRPSHSHVQALVDGSVVAVQEGGYDGDFLVKFLPEGNLDPHFEISAFTYLQPGEPSRPSARGGPPSLQLIMDSVGGIKAFGRFIGVNGKPRFRYARFHPTGELATGAPMEILSLDQEGEFLFDSKLTTSAALEFSPDLEIWNVHTNVFLEKGLNRPPVKILGSKNQRFYRLRQLP